jgi:hypothetical protein
MGIWRNIGKIVILLFHKFSIYHIYITQDDNPFIVLRKQWKQTTIQL